MTSPQKTPSPLPPLAPPWQAGGVVVLVAGVGLLFLRPLLEDKVRWPALLTVPALGLTAAWLGLVTVLLVDGLARLSPRGEPPRDDAGQQRWLAGHLAHAQGACGLRLVAAAPQEALARYFAACQQRLADRWAYRAILAFLLGCGWLLLYLARGVEGADAETLGDGSALLFVGLLQAVLVLAGTAGLWVSWKQRLGRWQEAALALAQEPEPQTPPEPARNEQHATTAAKPTQEIRQEKEPIAAAPEPPRSSIDW